MAKVRAMRPDNDPTGWDVQEMVSFSMDEEKGNYTMTVREVRTCLTDGRVHRGRESVHPDRWERCEETDAERTLGSGSPHAMHFRRITGSTD